MDDAYTLQVHNRVTHREIDDGTSLIPGGPKNVPNFRMALCNRVGEMNQQKSMYVMSKHLRICL